MNHSGTSPTSRGLKPDKNWRVASRSNFGSHAWMHRKKRSRLASAKCGTLKTGWYGIGRPFMNNMPNTAVRDAHRTVNSNVTDRKAGQLLRGLPPTLIG